MQVEDLVLGLRSTDVDVLDVARALLAEHVVDGYDAGPNVSMWIATDDDGTPARPLHRLYRLGTTTLRTKSLRRLLLGSLAHLESFGPVPDGLVELDARLLVRDARAIVVADQWGVALDALHEGRLRRLGWTLSDVVRPRLDPESLQIVVAPPTLQPIAAGLERLAALDPDPVDDPNRAGRYALAGVVTLTFGGLEDVERSSLAARVANLSPLVRRADRTFTVDDFALTRRLAETVRVEYAAGSDAKAVADVISSLG